jgi:hypothetical protein
MSEIITFDRNSIWDKRDKPPVVRVAKNGTVRFSVSAVKLLGLKESDCLTFQIDYRDTDVVYFFKDKNGIPLRVGAEYDSGIMLQTLCRPLVKKLLQFFGLKGNTTFDITDEQTSGKYVISKLKIHEPLKWRPAKDNQPYTFSQSISKYKD